MTRKDNDLPFQRLQSFKHQERLQREVVSLQGIPYFFLEHIVLNLDLGWLLGCLKPVLTRESRKLAFSFEFVDGWAS